MKTFRFRLTWHNGKIRTLNIYALSLREAYISMIELSPMTVDDHIIKIEWIGLK